MPLSLNPSFNMLGWSLAVFLVYVLIQVVVTFGYAMFGAMFHPALGIFVWFAASAAIGHALLVRHSPSRAELALVQGFACFYMALCAVAITLQRDTPFDLPLLGQILVVVIAFFVAGFFGFQLASLLRNRAHRSSAQRFH